MSKTVSMQYFDGTIQELLDYLNEFKTLWLEYCFRRLNNLIYEEYVLNKRELDGSTIQKNLEEAAAKKFCSIFEKWDVRASVSVFFDEKGKILVVPFVTPTAFSRADNPPEFGKNDPRFRKKFIYTDANDGPHNTPAKEKKYNYLFRNGFRYDQNSFEFLLSDGYFDIFTLTEKLWERYKLNHGKAGDV